MEAGVRAVIIDNTNLQAHEAHPYILTAAEHGYAYDLLLENHISVESQCIVSHAGKLLGA
jgi:hypothetical protein